MNKCRISLNMKTNKEKLLGFFGKGGVDEKAVMELRFLWKKWSRSMGWRKGVIDYI
jgi:hypothetical protein